MWLDCRWLKCAQMSLDEATYIRRLEHEGVSFLSCLLPQFLKGVLVGLERGEFSPVDFPNFRFRRGYPVFMSGMLRELVLNIRLRDGGLESAGERAAEILQAIQQLCGWYGKVFELPDQSACDEAIESYVAVEAEIEDVGRSDIGSRCRSVLARHLGDLLSSADSRVAAVTIRGHHGPGAVVEGWVGNEKFSNLTWSSRLESVLPSSDMIAFPTHQSWCASVEILEEAAEPPVKVSLVPKTAKSPRVIAIEPCYRQFAQQGIADALAAVCRSKWIDIHDQHANQRLARAGSVDRSFATIDLSNASDRLPLWLVKDALAPWPNLLKALLASRGEKAVLPDKRVISLRKFASAGSATCFPVESLIFWALAAVGMTEAGCRVRPDSIRVYGDDIIVPSRSMRCVLDALHESGAKVNERKTFVRSPFRESCGGEYLYGHDVGYVKLRRLPGPGKPLKEWIESFVAFRNLLYDRGYWNTARECDRVLATRRVRLPIGEVSSSGLMRQSVFHWRAQRWSRDTSAPLVRAFVVSHGCYRAPLTERGALMKMLGAPSQEPRPIDHQVHEGRSSRVAMKVRWVTPY